MSTYDSKLASYKVYLNEEHEWTSKEIEEHVKDDADNIRMLIEDGFDNEDIFYYFD